jgi:hypothetical protein
MKEIEQETLTHQVIDPNAVLTFEGHTSNITGRDGYNGPRVDNRNGYHGTSDGRSGKSAPRANSSNPNHVQINNQRRFGNGGTFTGQHVNNFGSSNGVAFHCEGKWMVTSSEGGVIKI